MTAKPYVGKKITVTYDVERCRHFAECVHGLPRVFDIKRKPWIEADNASALQVAEIVRRCPSGALHYVLTDGEPEVPDVPTTVSVTPGGPTLLRGDLELVTADGVHLRETRLALCACGRSERQPFCDATMR